MTVKDKIFELEAINRELQKSFNELNEFTNNQCIKLLKQIEKMKCCGNCNNALTQACYNCIRDSDSATQDLWEFANWRNEGDK